MPAGGSCSQQLGAVPRVLVWDGEGAVGRWRARRPELTAACQAFRGVLGAKVLICKPADPEAKGLVERLHDYLETVVPARPQLQLARPTSTPSWPSWLERANRRRQRVAGLRARRTGSTRTGRRCWRCRRCRRSPAGEHRLRLPRDHYVRLDSNDYSVHPRRSAGGSRSGPTWTGSRCGARARLVADHAAGLGPAPDHLRPRPPGRRAGCCAGAGSTWSAHRRKPRSRSATLTDYDTALGVAGADGGGGVMADQDRDRRPGPDRRAGVS